MLRGRTVVLLVTHESEERETLGRGLRMLGIDCLVAADADQASATLWGPLGEHVDLLLTDLTQAGSAGARLIAVAHATRRSLPVLVLAGLVLTPEALSIRASGIPMLRKPFTHELLGTAIAEALRSGTGPSRNPERLE